MSPQKIQSGTKNLSRLSVHPVCLGLAGTLSLCVHPVWADEASPLDKTGNTTGGNKTVVAQAAPAVPASSGTRLPQQAAADAGKEKAEADKPTIFKEMVVTGDVEKDSHYTSPSTRVTRAQIERQNAQTTEEVLKYQPSLQIRQRYIGDPNGVIGIRGADMFSTARNMVYADGLPLHNFLQASFNGAPRWSMVGPNEIDAVDVVYGPFSAEYSGNSIGGVVNIKTRMPKKQEMYFEGSVFVQPWKFYGPDKGTFVGDRQYVSYGNRFMDKISLFMSYNRLEAQSQPMTYFIDNTGLNRTGPPAPTSVNGGIPVLDTRGTPSIIYGDTGPEKVHTDLGKFKLGYDITPTLQAIFTAGVENRTRSADHPRNYLTRTTGQPFWGGVQPSNVLTGGNAVLADGTRFDVSQRGFGVSEDKRETLQLGLQLHGAITPTWNIDTTISHFNVLKDIRSLTFFNPKDPGNNGSGQIQDFKQFDWLNADLKLGTHSLFGDSRVSFITGYHFEDYHLSFRQYNMTNGGRGTLQSNRNNDGQTSLHAVFGQFGVRFAPDWDLTFGVRGEWWAARNGTVGGVSVADRDDSAASPKVSLGYEPGPWKIRYSFGRAVRFPVIAEMYQSLNTPTSITTANALLKPERGYHHNMMVEYTLPKGYMRVNAFRDDITDAIQQVQRASGILTQNAFQNIGETSTTGVEMIFDQRRILSTPVDFNFNVTWMNAKVEKGPVVLFQENFSNTATPFDMTGKQRIRLPHWRVNFFTTYHATEEWDLSLGGRYIADSFNDIDNKDRINGVFGAQDGYFFLDFKTSYRFVFGPGVKSRLSFGITNLNNDTAFVFHPYPQRTYFAEMALSY